MAKRHYEIDIQAIREMELFINNTSSIYFGSVIPLL